MFLLHDLQSPSTSKSLDLPVSSDGMIMRASYKVRFEVESNNLFSSKGGLKLKTQSLKLKNLQEAEIKSKLEKQLEMENSRNPLVDFPIHLIHEDSEAEFISPLDRAELPQHAKYARKNTISSK